MKNMLILQYEQASCTSSIITTPEPGQDSQLGNQAWNFNNKYKFYPKTEKSEKWDFRRKIKVARFKLCHQFRSSNEDMKFLNIQKTKRKKIQNCQNFLNTFFWNHLNFLTWFHPNSAQVDHLNLNWKPGCGFIFHFYQKQKYIVYWYRSREGWEILRIKYKI